LTTSIQTSVTHTISSAGCKPAVELKCLVSKGEPFTNVGDCQNLADLFKQPKRMRSGMLVTDKNGSGLHPLLHCIYKPTEAYDMLTLVGGRNKCVNLLAIDNTVYHINGGNTVILNIP